MEARQTLRGNAAPKGLIVLCAVGAVLGLAVAGAQVSKNIGRSSATENVIVHPAPGTVLRQDVGGSPVLLDRGAEGSAAQAAPAGAHGARTSGSQSIVDNGQAADGHGPDSDLTRALPSQAPSGNSGIGLAHGNRYI